MARGLISGGHIADKQGKLAQCTMHDSSISSFAPCVGGK